MRSYLVGREITEKKHNKLHITKASKVCRLHYSLVRHRSVLLIEQQRQTGRRKGFIKALIRY